MTRMAVVLSVLGLLRGLCASYDITAQQLAQLTNYSCPTGHGDLIGELVPLHRLYDPERKDHLLAADLNYIKEALGKGYAFDKTIGCVPLRADFAKCKPLVRFYEMYHPHMQTHLYMPKGRGGHGMQYWTDGVVDTGGHYFDVPDHSFFCVAPRAESRNGLCGAHKGLRLSLYSVPGNADHFYATDQTDIIHMTREGYKATGSGMGLKCFIW